jgi:succinyl-CoA synthetase beta subunit/citryl-CoA synthetase large subunit
MKLLEHQSKTLLSRFGLRFTQAALCTTAQEARDAAAGVGGPVVLKAQVPFGGRGKAGAVIFAETPEEAHRAAARLLGMQLQNHTVRTISVESKVAIAREFYAGISWDTAARRPVAILSLGGGVDVESSSSAIRRTFDPSAGLRAFEAREMARKANLIGKIFLDVATALHKLAEAFLALDGVTIEINPLAQTQSGELIGLDARVELDDDAEFRIRPHLPDLGALESSSTGRVPTALEKEAKRIDASDHRGVAGRVVEFDGDLALLIGGGGASLTVFDAIRRYNGRPANYCEVGGNPTEEKVAALTALLLNKPCVKRLAVIMNVVNNTRADIMARGVLEGIRRAQRSPRETIAVFRIPGSWEPEAKAILADAGVEALGREISLDTAAKMAVERMNAARS